MKTIGSRFRSQVNYSAGCSTVFGGEVVCDDVVLLHGIDRNLLADSKTEDTNVLDAIKQYFSSCLTLPIDCNAYSAAGQILSAVYVVGCVIAIADITG